MTGGLQLWEFKDHFIPDVGGWANWDAGLVSLDLWVSAASGDRWAMYAAISIAHS